MIRRTKGLLALLCALLPLPAASQDFSYDGNRWYEVEVIVFTNAPLGATPERAIPEQTLLEYPSRLIELIPASASLAVDFTPPAAQAPVPANAAGNGSEADERFRAPPFNPGLNPAPAALEAPPSPPFGPRFSPAAARAFRLTDFSKDAFVALGPAQRQLGQALRRLESSANHRVLYHAAWRQPGMSRAQSQAVFVRGGERFGDHDELEGSLLLTYVPGGVNLDVNLWLNAFRAMGLRDVRLGNMRVEEAGTGGWELPPQPFALPEAPLGSSRAPLYRVAEVARLRQSRNVALDVLNYFDHPALGVIVQVRPYVLPLPNSFVAE